MSCILPRTACEANTFLRTDGSVEVVDRIVGGGGGDIFPPPIRAMLGEPSPFREGTRCSFFHRFGARGRCQSQDDAALKIVQEYS